MNDGEYSSTINNEYWFSFIWSIFKFPLLFFLWAISCLGVLFNFYLFVDFPNFLLLLSMPFNLFWSKNILCFIYVLLNLLRLVLWLNVCQSQSFPGGSDGRESSCNAGDLGLIPGLGRSPGNGNGCLLQYFLSLSLFFFNILFYFPVIQYSYLENSMDRGTWPRLQPMRSQRVGHNWVTNTFTFHDQSWIMFDYICK